MDLDQERSKWEAVNMVIKLQVPQMQEVSELAEDLQAPPGPCSMS